MSSRLWVAAFLLGLSTLVACGGDDDDSGAAGSAGASGSAGAAGSAGSSGSSGAAGAAGNIPGLLTTTCSTPADKTCAIHGESTQAGIDALKQSCVDDGGTVVEHCPSAGVIGCCLISGVGQCFYDAAVAAQAQPVCTSNGGTWATSVP